MPHGQSQRRQMKKFCEKENLCVLCVLCVYSNAQAKDAQGKEVGALKGSKYTDEDRERALALISSGMSPTKAAKELGLPKSTVCHWWNTQMQDNEDVVAKRMEARRASVEKCGRTVERAHGAIGKQVTAAASGRRALADGLNVLTVDKSW